MDESEAKKFIADQVGTLVWQRLAIVASLFGIANIIALATLWGSITSQAKLISEEQVRSSAAKYASDSLDKFAEVTNAARERIAKFDQSYAELYTKIGETNANLRLLDTNKKILDASLADLSSESNRLSLTLNALKASDVTRAAETLNLIAAIPNENAQSIIKTFVELKPAFDKLAQRLTVAERGIPEAQLKALAAETRKQVENERQAAASAATRNTPSDSGRTGR